MLSIKHSPQGVDISDNNSEFDWHAWNGHLDFVMIKASQGHDYRDLQFDRNWRMAGEMDIHRFAYHYAIPDDDPAAQAKYFVETVRAQGLNLHDNFVLDLEEMNGKHPVDVSFWAWVFCHEVNLYTDGQRCLVYTYPAFAETGACARLGDRELWIANFGTPHPHVPLPWRTWAFWQYSGTGIDRDVFNGNEKDLDKFCTR